MREETACRQLCKELFPPVSLRIPGSAPGCCEREARWFAPPHSRKVPKRIQQNLAISVVIQDDAAGTFMDDDLPDPCFSCSHASKRSACARVICFCCSLSRMRPRLSCNMVAFISFSFTKKGAVREAPSAQFRLLRSPD